MGVMGVMSGWGQEKVCGDGWVGGGGFRTVGRRTTKMKEERRTQTRGGTNKNTLSMGQRGLFSGGWTGWVFRERRASAGV